jgi:uncharacterized membrane protein YbhN (UPF0104 family)
MALTCLAVMCDGLVPTLIFWSIGFPVSYGTALFGYTLFNMFYILPNPPGQVGSTEAAGLLVFTGLLHLPADKVAAMYIFCHPWAALVMSLTALICLKTLGLKFSTTIGIKPQPEESKLPEEVETPILR